VEELKTNTEQKFRKMLVDSYIDPSAKPPEPPMVFSKGYYYEGGKQNAIPICTKGNFSFIYAEEKRKKTFLVSLFCMAYLKPNNKYVGDIETHINEGKIVHFDTEQSEYHAHRVFSRGYRVCNDIKRYQTFGLRKYSWKERLDFIDWYLYSYDNIGFVIIDGIADLCKDTNDKEASEEISQRLLTWTEDLDVHIMTIIHANPNSDRAKGHLGTSLTEDLDVHIMTIIHANPNSDRAKGHLGTSLGAKCETKIFLDLIDRNNVLVTCKSSRNSGFEDFAFNVDNTGMPNVLEEIPERLDADKYINV
jgi:hypothetical protein